MTNNEMLPEAASKQGVLYKMNWLYRRNNYLSRYLFTDNELKLVLADAPHWVDATVKHSKPIMTYLALVSTGEKQFLFVYDKDITTGDISNVLIKTVINEVETTIPVTKITVSSDLRYTYLLDKSERELWVCPKFYDREEGKRYHGSI